MNAAKPSLKAVLQIGDGSIPSDVGSPVISSPEEGLSRSSSMSRKDDVAKKKSFFSSISSKLKKESRRRTNIDPEEVPAAITVPNTTAQSPSDAYIRASPAFDANDPLAASRHELAQVPFRRVTFALEKLPDQPQQQIPVSNPRPGDVITPDDLVAPVSRLSVKGAKDAQPPDPTVLRNAQEREKLMLAESRKHGEQAHVQALRVAKEVASYKTKKTKQSKVSEPETEFTVTMNHIDTPLHHHVAFNKERPSSVSTAEPSLDELYTRCCYLREILPIPVTLKQLKGKSKPLQTLKMLSPRPTLIDVLSFSDFLAIAPITTVVFDNVTLTTEMLQIVLISLSNSQRLEKLSLRNVPIDAQGWKYLCKFIATNESFEKLDISQQRIKPGITKEFYRSEMDWSLFTDSLIMKGGIEELVLNGCKLTYSQLDDLIDRALSIDTQRLGMASTGINPEMAQLLANWTTRPNTSCQGIDTAFNDLSSGQLQPFVQAFEANPDQVKLLYFSLNKTEVTLPEAEIFIKALSKLPTLRFLDLGNDSQLFPDIIPVLGQYLPQFPELRRVHFEFDNMSEVDIIKLSQVLSNCPKLVHVSLLGNATMTNKCATALYGAIKSSGIFNIEMDYSEVNEDLASRMAVYQMRNMEKYLNQTPHDEPINDEDLIFDGQLLARAAEELLKSDHTPEENAVFWEALESRTVHLRQEMHRIMDDLFSKRDRGTLDMAGKETLLRLCMMDDTLDTLLGIFDEQLEIHQPKRPLMMRRVSSQVPLHAAANGIISSAKIDSPVPEIEETNIQESEPHLVVEDNCHTVDGSTGRPVLIRRASSTSVHGKKMEEEEGETHKKSTEDYESKLQVSVPSGEELREKVMTNDVSNIADLRRVGSGTSMATTDDPEKTYDRLLDDAQRGRAAKPT